MRPDNGRNRPGQAPVDGVAGDVSEPAPVEAARQAFRHRFRRPEEGVALAPGRVNLIGEHVDYCGLPVLPAALSRGVALAFAARTDGNVRCLSTEPGFGETRFALRDAPPGDFGRYLSAAAAGLAAGGWTPGTSTTGFDGVLASDLPPASGLSSSSAIVIAGALALLAARGRLPSHSGLAPEDAARLAADLAAAEHGVAIEGGAMDQSIVLGAVPGHALHIAFTPPSWTAVPVDPSGFSLMVAFSGRRADKGAAAGRAFDERVRQARAAYSRLANAFRGADGYPGLVARWPLAELLAGAEQLPTPFRERFRHVVTEADRTTAAVAHLRSGDAPALGRVLDASHESLRRDYEVSTPELDALVEAARHSGALGARLTGAGFGGSVVILVKPGHESALRSGLSERYYGPRGIRNPERGHILDATPSGPAELVRSSG